MLFGGLKPPLGDVKDEFFGVIQPSIAYANDDDAELMRQIDDQEAIAWIVSNDDSIVAAAVTELRRDNGLQCFIRHCAGKGIDRWVHFIAGIEDWARWAGCDSIALAGRRGWARKLGWKWHDGKAVKVL